jgi:hypothetical protein
MATNSNPEALKKLLAQLYPTLEDYQRLRIGELMSLIPHYNHRGAYLLLRRAR